MTPYTLAQFAQFNRCLFPHDFRDDLIKHGINPLLASQIGDWLVRKRCGIVEVYQEFVVLANDDQGLGDAIEAILKDFFNK